MRLIAQQRALAALIARPQHIAAAADWLNTHLAALNEVHLVGRGIDAEDWLAGTEARGFEIGGHLLHLGGAKRGQRLEIAQPRVVHSGRRALLEAGGQRLAEHTAEGRVLRGHGIEVGLVEQPQVGVARGRCVLIAHLAGEHAQLAKEAVAANARFLLNDAHGVFGGQFNFALFHQIERLARLAHAVDAVPCRHMLQHHTLRQSLHHGDGRIGKEGHLLQTCNCLHLVAAAKARLHGARQTAPQTRVAAVDGVEGVGGETPNQAVGGGHDALRIGLVGQERERTHN